MPIPRSGWMGATAVTRSVNELAPRVTVTTKSPVAGIDARSSWALFLASDFTQASVAANGTLTTATGAEPTAYDPVATTVTSPVAAAITLNELQLDPSPTGYSFFGQQVVITASPNATVEGPFVFRFELDASLVPPDETKDTLVVLRNGEPVGPCSEPVTAVPTPCVALREALGAEGDIAITVRTVAASTWNFAAVRPYAFGGFLHPVDDPPVVNTTNAGNAVPVRFSLAATAGWRSSPRAHPLRRPSPATRTRRSTPSTRPSAPAHRR